MKGVAPSRRIAFVLAAGVAIFGTELFVSDLGFAQPAPAETTSVDPAPVAHGPVTPGPVKGETPAAVLDGQEVNGILGREVRGSAGENMGRIIDVIVNREGQVRAAIVDFGGFLGVGSRKIAVDWRVLHFAPEGKLDRIVLSLSRNELRVAPEYRPGEQVVVLGASPNTTVPTATVPPTPAPNALPSNAVPPPAAPAPSAQPAEK
jgi:hypothetical protein